MTYEDEIRARLAVGEPAQAVGEWFIDTLRSIPEPQRPPLSEYERAFLKPWLKERLEQWARDNSV